MKKRSGQYWHDRMKALENEQYAKTTEYYNDIQKQFRMAQNDVQIDIERWYQRLADNNDISLAAAKQLLKKDELEEFHWTVTEYIKHGEDNGVNQKWMKQLENASAKVHINRLEAMKIQVQQHAEILYQKYEHGMADFLGQTYAEGFYHTAYELAKGTGAGSNLARLGTDKIDKVICKPWAQDGKSFSDRIWENKDKLVRELHTELAQSIIRGENPDEAAKRLANKMGSKLSQARTLVYTESAAISAASQKDSFSELGVGEFEVVETLDSHTCKTCGDMDGQHFPMKDFEIGITAPPFHPRCRGCTCPYFDDEFTNGKRVARGEDGKEYFVPENTTYNEWKKKFVSKEEKNADSKKANYFIRSHAPGQDTSKERLLIDGVISKMSEKVKNVLTNTVIDIGKNGASQYDYNNDILYIAKNADEEAIIHEIGHLVENKMIDPARAEKVRKAIIGEVDIWSLTTKTYYDAAGNAIDIVLLENSNLISEYQGRVYADTIWDAFDDAGNFKDDLLWEMYAEPFRLYCENPKELEKRCPEMFELIKETVE